MIKDRLIEDADKAVSTYADWYLIGALLLVTLTGFATEVLHYIRLEPHRHIVYFVHLVCVFTGLVKPDMFIDKPIDPELVIAKVKELIGT